MFNNNNKLIINIINYDNEILMLINLFFIKIELIVYRINFNNLTNYINNIIIAKHRLFTNNKIIIQYIKKRIDYIKINMLIEMNISLLFYKRNLKINCKPSLLKINH